MEAVENLVIVAGQLAALYEHTKEPITLKKFLDHYQGFLSNENCEVMWNEQRKVLSDFESLCVAEPPRTLQ
jgi:hypothetical protein